jgi:exosortase
MIHRAEVFDNERTFSLGWKGRLGILMVVLVGLGFFLYQDALWELISSVLNREGSSHGIFVPFISAYFLWMKRERIRNVEIDFSLLAGGLVLALSFIILYFSRGSAEITLPAFSFVLAACGLVLALFGMRLFKELAFPLLFLATMIPIPETVFNQIAEWMRQATTSGSVWLSHLLHLPIYREGYNIQLPGSRIFIAMGCSGIRYLLSYFVFSLAYAYMCKNSFGTRCLVVLASFPIALVGGVMRLSSIYLAVYFIGPFMAEHRPHILVSWFVFLAVLVIAVAADQYLSGLKARRSK